MDKEKRLAILLEGQKNGVQQTCSAHGISRTLYYRWLKRYKDEGLNGLNPISRHFVPANRTPASVERTLLSLVQRFPAYGPRALLYELQRLDLQLSESAVYNMLKRLKLTQRQQRQRFVRSRLPETKRDLQQTHQQGSLTPPNLMTEPSGAAWFFWSTPLGDFNGLGPLYLYTVMDFHSRIACSRLYPTQNSAMLLDLLTAVALPVAQTLNLDIHYLYLPSDESRATGGPRALPDIQGALTQSGFEVSLWTTLSEGDTQHIDVLKASYNRGALELLLAQSNPLTLSDLRYALQDYMRDYNLQAPVHPPELGLSPLGYHARAAQTETILPLWAYLHRDY